MKKKVYRERYSNKGITFANKGIAFKVDELTDEITQEKKPRKRASKKKEA